MNDKTGGERVTGRSVLAARRDDDEMWYGGGGGGLGFINLWRLFNAKFVFIQIIISISNNLV